MIENQAYIIALMLLVASPLAIATDEGQAVLERFDRTPDDLLDIEKNDRTEVLDDLLNDVPADRMNTRDVVEDCYTLEQWKERLTEGDWNKEDWDRESNEVREDEDGARGNSDDKKEKEDYNKVTDKVTDKDCFTEVEFEEFVGKMGNKDRVDRDCVTVGQVREKWERIREGARDRDWDRDYDRDDDEDDSDDESDEGRDNDEDEGPNARGGDEEESDEDHGLNDEKRAELFAAIGELKEACEDGDEAACVELRELLEEFRGEHEGDWDREQKDGDDSRCVSKHMMNHMKKMFKRDRDENDRDRDYDRDWERDNDEEWEELRAVMAELGAACDEGDEIACEELEELITELQNDAWERDEDCDEDDENDHDEDDEDDSEDEEDDSEDDEPENA